MCLFGGTLACYVTKLVAVIAADFVLAATTTAAASPRAVARPVISSTAFVAGRAVIVRCCSFAATTAAAAFRTIPRDVTDSAAVVALAVIHLLVGAVAGEMTRLTAIVASTTVGRRHTRVWTVTLDVAGFTTVVARWILISRAVLGNVSKFVTIVAAFVLLRTVARKMSH